MVTGELELRFGFFGRNDGWLNGMEMMSRDEYLSEIHALAKYIKSLF